jgi:hypothetical protein
MQFLVDVPPEECLAKARELFSTNWPYGGNWYQQPNRIYLVGPDPDPDTWGNNIKQLFLIVITFGLYFIYWLLKPIRTAGTAEVAVASEGGSTRLSVAATEAKYQRVLEQWVKKQFPSAKAVPPQQEVPIVIQQHPIPIQTSSQPDDIPNQIKNLAELRDTGAITNEEFERKKAELLDRM